MWPLDLLLCMHETTLLAKLSTCWVRFGSRGALDPGHSEICVAPGREYAPLRPRPWFSVIGLGTQTWGARTQPKPGSAPRGTPASCHPTSLLGFKADSQTSHIVSKGLLLLTSLPRQRLLCSHTVSAASSGSPPFLTRKLRSTPVQTLALPTRGSFPCRLEI